MDKCLTTSLSLVDDVQEMKQEIAILYGDIASIQETLINLDRVVHSCPMNKVGQPTRISLLKDDI